MIRPGVAVTTSNAGGVDLPDVPVGNVACLFQSTWGPLASVQTLETYQSIETIFGVGGNTDAPRQVFLGGAKQVYAYRLGGSGAAKATKNLVDTTGSPVDAVKIDALYEGTRGNAFRLTVRDSLADATKRELLVLEGTALLETFTFTKGSDGVGEPASLVAAVAAQGSSYIAASKLADGTKLLLAASAAAMASGVEPTVNGASFTAGLTAVEGKAFDVLVTDSVDTSIHASLKTYIDRIRGEGHRSILVLGEPTSVAQDTRLADAAAFNDPAVVYVANGFKDSAGTTREGYMAACRVAGMIASQPVTGSLTHTAVTGATALVGGMTNADIQLAILSGCLVFTASNAGRIRIEYGINTLVSLAANQDAGWKKIRRLRTRDNLIARCVAAWETMVGTVNNNASGQAALIAAAMKVVSQMIGEGALQSGTVVLDTANPPAGDEASFKATIVDNDSAEKITIDFGFSF